MLELHLHHLNVVVFNTEQDVKVIPAHFFHETQQSLTHMHKNVIKETTAVWTQSVLRRLVLHVHSVVETVHVNLYLSSHLALWWSQCLWLGTSCCLFFLFQCAIWSKPTNFTFSGVVGDWEMEWVGEVAERLWREGFTSFFFNSMLTYHSLHHI